MSEPSIESGNVVAWTEHDGPGRPPAGPPARAYHTLAAGFAGWFALALVGCELIHHGGGDHVPLSTAEVVGGTAVFLGLPALVVLLARRHPAGPWLAALLGGLAAAVSATQWSLAPAYTTVEAAGFAVLGLAGLVLGAAQLRARLAPARPVAVDGPASQPVAGAPPARPAATSTTR